MKYKIRSSRIIIFTLVLVFFLDGCAVALGVTDNPSAVNQGAELGTGPFVGYEKDASADSFEVYTKVNGTYIRSLPYALFDQFPASDRTNPNWQPGWMNVDIYCGTIADFAWAVVCTGSSGGTGNANVCTSMDGGKTWRIGDIDTIYPGTVAGAGFSSTEVGFMSYRYYFDCGPEISRTLDGGKTWNRMAIDIPNDLRGRKMTPLVPTFTGKKGIYPIKLYSDDSDSYSIIHLVTGDGGLTWQWNANADSSHLIDQLVDSITYASGEIRFQVPSDVINPKDLNIHIAGRAVYEDGFSRSLHFLETESAENSWVAGKTYSIPFDPNDTELTMNLYVTAENGTIIEKDIDLMSTLKLQEKR